MYWLVYQYLCHLLCGEFYLWERAHGVKKAKFVLRYSQACDNFMVNNPGRSTTEAELGHLFEKAYSMAATVCNACKVFKAWFIESFDDQIFSKVDFSAFGVYERPIEGAAGAAQPGSSSRSSEPTIYVMVPNDNCVLALPLAKMVARRRKRSTLSSMVIISIPVK